MAVLTSLHACGFQLRGSINLSEDISPIYIKQGNMFDLARDIKLLMESNKIQVADSVGQSKSQLTLLNEDKSRRVLSVDSNGRVREYQLNYKVDFIVNTASLMAVVTENATAGSNQDSAPLDAIAHDSVSVARRLIFDPDAVLAVTNEAEILYRDMRHDAARLILLKLQARANANNKGQTSGPSPAGNPVSKPASK